MCPLPYPAAPTCHRDGEFRSGNSNRHPQLSVGFRLSTQNPPVPRLVRGIHVLFAATLRRGSPDTSGDGLLLAGQLVPMLADISLWARSFRARRSNLPVSVAGSSVQISIRSGTL